MCFRVWRPYARVCTTVCTYINHILVSLNKEIATQFLLIKQLFVPSVHVVRPKIKKQYKEPVPLP